MHNSNELLHQSFAVFIFCAAVTFLFFGYRSYTAAFNTSKDIVKNEIIYEQYNQLEEHTFTKGEITALLFCPLEYDIEIDDLFISKTENVKDNLETYDISDKKYLKSYVYDNNGNILRIKFTSK